MAKRRRGESHVRLYRHELECAAYRSLGTDARALLVELRALYNGRDNRIHMSIREAMRRLGVGRWRAERALAELLDRGFIRLIEPGGFSRKTKHATVYALTNEPPDDRDGSVPPKDYMRWPRNSSVLVTSTDGVSHQHREPNSDLQHRRHGVSHQHREVKDRGELGVSHQHTDRLPLGVSDPELQHG